HQPSKVYSILLPVLLLPVLLPILLQLQGGRILSRILIVLLHIEPCRFQGSAGADPHRTRARGDREEQELCIADTDRAGPAPAALGGGSEGVDDRTLFNASFELFVQARSRGLPIPHRRIIPRCPDQARSRDLREVRPWFPDDRVVHATQAVPP